MNRKPLYVYVLMALAQIGAEWRAAHRRELVQRRRERGTA